MAYFVIGIRFGHDLMPDECTFIGEFAVFSLITILSALLVNAYCEKKKVFRNILLYHGGSIVLALLFSIYVIPFNLIYFYILNVQDWLFIFCICPFMNVS